MTSDNDQLGNGPVYRHGFHAGNYADVHKHVILTLLLERLKRKSPCLCYIDTHAGAGLYGLQSEFAQKEREYETGISRLWRLPDMPEIVHCYLDIVRRVNPRAGCRNNSLRFYPGSPLIAQHLLRKSDHLLLLERDNNESSLLKKRLAGDKRVDVYCCDAFTGLERLLPAGDKQGLVLIDPPYENRCSPAEIINAVIHLRHAWPAAVYAVWYPVYEQQAPVWFGHELHRRDRQCIYVSEFRSLADTGQAHMTGSGMAVINPAEQDTRLIAEVTGWLAAVLKRGTTGRPCCDWLQSETGQK